MSVWYFEERSPKGVSNTPKHEEHFAHVRGIVASVVRELSQNSGDASDESTGKPVRLTFRFDKLDRSKFAPLISGLEPHLSSFPVQAQLLEGRSMVPYLAVEDFNTHGLRGSYDESAESYESAYIAFWHRYGESGKASPHFSQIAGASGF